MGDSNHRSSTRHRRRRKDEESDAEEEKDNGGEREGGRERKRENSSRRREKKKVKDGVFDRDSDDGDRIRSRDDKKIRGKDRIRSREHDEDSDDGDRVISRNDKKVREKDRIGGRDSDVVEEKDRDIDSDDGDRIRSRGDKKVREKEPNIDSDDGDRIRSRSDKKIREKDRVQSRDRDVVEEKDRDVDSDDGNRIRSRDDKKIREKDRLKERYGDKKRIRDVVEEKEQDIDSDDDGDKIIIRDDKIIRENDRLKVRDRAAEDGIRSRDRDVVKEKHRDIESDDGERVKIRVDKRSRNRDRERDSVDRDRLHGRDTDKDRDEESEDVVEAEREREKERVREEKEKRREKEKREREREEKEREKKKREREREREREEREREREREEREKEREKERERERKKREREKEERERQKEKEREREKRARNEERERGKRCDDQSDGEDDRDRKRRRRDDDRKEERDRSRKRHREDSEDDSVKRKERESLPEKKKETTREEDMEEEQRVLDEEMEKRRRRVQEWQELKRKKEESEKEKEGEGDDFESRKKWTLEGESDDDEVEGDDKADTDMNIEENNKSEVAIENGMDIDSEKDEKEESLVENGGTGDIDDDEIDPLDAFMNSMILPEVEKLTNNAPPAVSNEMETDSKTEKASTGKIASTVKKGLGKSLGRIIPGEESESDYEEDEEEEDPLEEDDEEFLKRVKKTKVDKIVLVDHSKIDYPPFRKNFYKEVNEISRMSLEEVSNYRKQLELKLHGKDIPKPVHTWNQIGLSTKILDTIKKLEFEKPMPVQAQALPIIMSGRDCIGVAKTGSGKTLAFVLPMLRHIKDQPPLMSGDGPIGLIMAPTRELVRQIHNDIKNFIKPLGITCVPVYGGSGVAQQIGELKRGAEIVVCTPGRMIDILCTSAGKITNLRRVTYLVMDEADRMFDMGFEPQITRIVKNIRPDRQTVLFSATFPHSVEALAKKVLNKNAVQIQIGGRSVVNKDITQLVEVRPEEERFFRLLELLGEWYEKGKILIFVHSQDKCDALFKYLLSQGYPCLSLHGGKEQTDRESTISDFKSNVCNLLVATSVAARGLDVKDLELVINFDVPNHYEDYVHRVGRTGRAGRKGCAITFISEADAKYAPDLLKALQLSDQVVPDDLKALADGFMLKVNEGLEQARSTGYGGSGFKFNEAEEEAKKAEKKAQAKQFGFEEDKSDSDDDDDGVRKAGGDLSQQVVLAQAAAFAAASKATSASSMGTNGGVLPVSLQGVVSAAVPGGDGAARAAALAAAMNLQHSLAKIQADAMPEHYEAELEINELPQNARWRVTHKETLGPISEWTGAAITTRGQYFPPGKIAGPGDRKLYLFIEGPNEKSVKMAKAELKHALERITQGTLPGGSGQTGKYSVL